MDGVVDVQQEHAAPVRSPRIIFRAAHHRRQFLSVPAALTAALHLDRHRPEPPIAVPDELHNYRGWKSLLNGPRRLPGPDISQPAILRA